MSGERGRVSAFFGQEYVRSKAEATDYPATKSDQIGNAKQKTRSHAFRDLRRTARGSRTSISGKIMSSSIISV